MSFMDLLIVVFIGGICYSQGMKAYNSEETTKVFVKYPLKVDDVKAYNHFCGQLIWGFGVVAVLAMLMMTLLGGWFSLIGIVIMIVAVFVLPTLYRKGEKKFRSRK